MQWNRSVQVRSTQAHSVREQIGPDRIVRVLPVRMRAGRGSNAAHRTGHARTDLSLSGRSLTGQSLADRDRADLHPTGLTGPDLTGPTVPAARDAPVRELTARRGHLPPARASRAPAAHGQAASLERLPAVRTARGPRRAQVQARVRPARAVGSPDPALAAPESQLPAPVPSHRTAQSQAEQLSPVTRERVQVPAQSGRVRVREESAPAARSAASRYVAPQAAQLRHDSFRGEDRKYAILWLHLLQEVI